MTKQKHSCHSELDSESLATYKVQLKIENVKDSVSQHGMTNENENSCHSELDSESLTTDKVQINYRT